MKKVGKKNPEGRPQKGARKLTIDGDTWWYAIPGGSDRVLIWTPGGLKQLYWHSAITKDPVITPFDIRLFIDEHIRELPAHEIKAFVLAREARIKKERKELVESVRRSVLERAQSIVVHSNDLYDESYANFNGGGGIHIKNRAENKRFLEDLMWVLSYDAAEDYHEATTKPVSKKDSWDY